LRSVPDIVITREVMMGIRAEAGDGGSRGL
jgi:hypothetical protein